MQKHLQNICEKEGLTHTNAALNIITKIAEGCVRDAVKYVDQVSVLGDINEDHITKFLGVAPESMISDFLDMIKAQDKKLVFERIDAIHDQGVDLHNFAKQSLRYIDEQFVNDIDFFANMSEIFSEIISSIRYYPYPTIVYKISINKHINGGNVQHTETQKTSTPISKPAKEEKKEAPIETTSAASIPDSWPALGTPGFPISNSQSPIPDKQIPNSSNTSDYNEDTLLEGILTHLEHGTFRDNLQDQMVIDEITESKIVVIAINKVAEMMLKKAENITKIQKICRDLLGKDVMIEVKFENKEAYFARKLG